MLVCAADWIGMSENDLSNALGVLLDLSKFPTLPDRLQQGFLDFLFIGRALIHPNGLAANPAFRDAGGSLIDTRRLFYYGNSQGGIAGGALTALAPDFNRSVLYVGAMNYSLLVERSVDFDPFGAVLDTSYPSRLERPLLLSLIQMLWDRGEPNGYAWHMTNDPLPDTPRHKVLQLLSFGDHQVANVATEVEARTIGSHASPAGGRSRTPHRRAALLRHPADLEVPVRRRRVAGGLGHRTAARRRPRHPGAADHEHAAARRGGPARPRDRVRGPHPQADRGVPAHRRARDRRVRAVPLPRRGLDRAVGRRNGSRAGYPASLMETGTFRVKSGLAEMLKGGVIMDVVDAEQAKVAEDAGAAAVMALERVPADIRADGGVARMSDPTMIAGIQEAVSIPVMAKARIGHFVEAQVLQALEVDYVDESEVLTPADEAHHIDKWRFDVPFVCGATNLGEALRRIAEGAAMIRSKGEAGTGNVVEAVRHIRLITGEVRRLGSLSEMELPTAAKELQAPLELVREVAAKGRLPVVLFCAGGIATPADAALMMQLGAEGNFVGSGIFKSSDPARRARAIVEATTHFDDPERVAAASRELGDAMPGIEIGTLEANGGLLQKRGW